MRMGARFYLYNGKYIIGVINIFLHISLCSQTNFVKFPKIEKNACKSNRNMIIYLSREDDLL